MARVKIKFPKEKFLFSCCIPVRIGDVNYGGHVGNDSVLSLMHEARLQMLHSWGMSEIDAGGSSLIMADVMIGYKEESFYGDLIVVEIMADEVGERSFDLLYKLSATRDGAPSVIATSKTGMVGYDYDKKQVTPLGKQLLIKLESEGTV